MHAHLRTPRATLGWLENQSGLAAKIDILHDLRLRQLGRNGFLLLVSAARLLGTQPKRFVVRQGVAPAIQGERPLVSISKKK